MSTRVTISERANKSGYFPAEAINASCTGCAMCAIICPDAVITVLREDNVTEIKTGPKKKAKLAEEKV
jgi:formate hydrogenlyase subunit 6/NADH:ubiquinone oxidoreductase subunit I